MLVSNLRDWTVTVQGADILPWVEKICSVLDETLHLKLKDEYELAHTVLQALLVWLCRVRILETEPRLRS